MVYAHHLIWTVYGYWLPNDPRGSMSTQVCAENIIDLGDIHYGRKRIQPVGWVIRDFQRSAAAVLDHELLKLKQEEAEKIASAFETVIADQNYTCYGCAIMPDHIHLLVRKHRDSAEQMIQHFQRESRIAVCDLQLRALDHPVWGGPGWKVFLDSCEGIRRTIRYIEQNPIKIALPRQIWKFVKPYDGWKPGLVHFAKPQANRPRSLGS